MPQCWCCHKSGQRAIPRRTSGSVCCGSLASTLGWLWHRRCVSHQPAWWYRMQFRHHLKWKLDCANIICGVQMPSSRWGWPTEICHSLFMTESDFITQQNGRSNPKNSNVIDPLDMVVFSWLWRHSNCWKTQQWKNKCGIQLADKIL